jgi:two-component system response regulator
MADSCILVAEDDEDASLLMQEAFREAGLTGRVMVVRNGEETINYLAGKEFYRDREKYPWPALLLLDLKMPKVDGFGVLAWWRRTNRTIELPIVVMSSSNQERDIQRAMELGATSYCVKPCSFQYLVHVAAELRDRWLLVHPAPLARV